GEVLADTLAVLEDVVDRRIRQCDMRRVLEVGMDVIGDPRDEGAQWHPGLRFQGVEKGSQARGRLHRPAQTQEINDLQLPGIQGKRIKGRYGGKIARLAMGLDDTGGQETNFLMRRQDIEMMHTVAETVMITKRLSRWTYRQME